MLLVNNPGSWGHIYWPLEHAAWNGWTLTDLVFPFFLFMVGMSMTYSFQRRLAEGAAKRPLMVHVLRRSAALILLGWWGGTWSPVLFPGSAGIEGTGAIVLRLGFVGSVLAAVVLLAGSVRPNRWWIVLVASLLATAAGVFLSGFEDPLLTRLAGMRIPGVLVRIGACYLAASVIFLKTPSRNAIIWWIVALLGAYAIWMLLIPIPGFGLPDLSRGFPTDATPAGELFSNWAFYLDYHILGTHTWSARQLFDGSGDLIWSFDPEGVISTISATCSVLFGILAGQWMRRDDHTQAEKLNGLFVAACWLLGLGLVMSIWFPINKRIWTSSYTVFTSGMALLVLGFLYSLLDIQGKRRWARPFRSYGRNAIFAFVASGMMATSLSLIRLEGSSLKGALYGALESGLGSPKLASLVFAVLFVTLWALIADWMDQRKIYFKL